MVLYKLGRSCSRWVGIELAKGHIGSINDRNTVCCISSINSLRPSDTYHICVSKPTIIVSDEPVRTKSPSFNRVDFFSVIHCSIGVRMTQVFRVQFSWGRYSGCLHWDNSMRRNAPVKYAVICQNFQNETRIEPMLEVRHRSGFGSILVPYGMSNSWMFYCLMRYAYTAWNIPDSKVHGANLGPTWVLSVPDGPHVGPMNLAIRDAFESVHLATANGSLESPAAMGRVPAHHRT